MTTKIDKKATGREDILMTSARLFREHGYERTSLKKIAEACGMLPGSLHYRYNTKEALLVDLMRFALHYASNEVLRACAGVADPVEQLRRGINAHLQALVADTDLVYVLLFEWDALQGEARDEMIALRDGYESLWGDMLNVLRARGVIRADVDIELLRLIGLGAVNWVATWYRPGGRYSLQDIGDFIWRIIMDAMLTPEYRPDTPPAP